MCLDTTPSDHGASPLRGTRRRLSCDSDAFDPWNKVDPFAMWRLKQSLQALRDQLDGEMRGKWDRSLPFADSLFDRWDRARRLGFGEESSAYDSALFFGNVSVGAHTWIGPCVILDGSGAELTIGDFCDISAGAQIWTHGTELRCVSLGEIPASHGAVSVGTGTYIGSQSIVVPGVKIGSRCIVGANSFVNRDVPDRSVVVGSPAQAIGQVVGDGSDTRIVYQPDQ